MPIHILPARLANQIAAGEVVERPASVIKELVENSIDAGANDILIEIDQGGHKRILIRDNGGGIAKDELELALSRHATSKISEIEDLEAITSLGFRGEALASISSVSRLTLTSKPAAQAQAWQAHCEGRDMQVQLYPAAHPNGTSIEVLDLFFNTPARRKFLRGQKTEFQHIDEICKRIALSHHEVGFTIKHNGKVIHKWPALAGNMPQRRVAAICGQGFMDNAVTVSGNYADIRISGWCSAIGQGRRTNDLQYSFINGRMMKDRVILHAIRQAFEGMIAPQEYPSFVIFIQMPPDQLDVNVHPAKHEVRFHQSRQVHDLLYKSISDALLAHANQNDHTAQAHSSLDHVPQHAYGEHAASAQHTQHASVQQDEHDVSYISALRVNQELPNSGTPLPASTAASGHGQGVSERRASAAGSYSSRPDPLAARHYASLLTANDARANETSSTEHNTSDALLLADGLLIRHENKLYQLPVYVLQAANLYKQMQASEVMQPLLMPVSLAYQASFSAMQAALNAHKFDVQLQANKLILKQVPACCRTLPWVSVFPALFNLSSEPKNCLELLHMISFLSLKNQSLPAPIVHEVWQQYAASERSELLSSFANVIDVPAVCAPDGLM